MADVAKLLQKYVAFVEHLRKDLAEVTGDPQWLDESKKSLSVVRSRLKAGLKHKAESKAKPAVKRKAAPAAAPKLPSKSALKAMLQEIRLEEREAKRQRLASEE